MKHKFPLLLLILVSVGMTLTGATQRNDTFTALDSYVHASMRSNRIPGFAVAVVRDGAVVYSAGYGIADPTRTAVDADTPFLIASVSKSFTAAAIMQLVERGLVDLDAPVQRYLDSFALADKASASSITVRHLLNHTSGLPPEAEYRVASLRGDDVSIAHMVQRMASLTTTAIPGTLFQYNNANYIILGALIEEVSGTSYAAFINDNILRPLSMQHTFLDGEEASAQGMATGYRTVFGYPMAARLPYRQDFLPAYSIVSSANDLGTYVSMLMQGGMLNGVRILSPHSIEQMFNPSSRVSASLSYGFGWYVSGSTVYHGGETTNFQAKLKILRDDGVAVVTLSNASSSTLSMLFGFGYRDRIESGIIDILYGYAPDYIPVNAGLLDLNRYPAQVTFILYLVLAGWVVTRLGKTVFKTREYGRLLRYGRRRPLGWSIASLVFMHAVVPSTILVAIPLLSHQSWLAIIFYVPDVGILLVVTALVLLATGCVKAAIMYRYIVDPDKPFSAVGTNRTC